MGLYDRDYMRERSKSPLNALFDGNFSAVGVLIVANVVCFIVGAFVASTSWGPSIFSFFELSLNGLLHGRIWTLVTYSFLHYDFLHIFLNMLGLFFIGKYLEHFLGPRKFLAVYFCGAVLGGLIWLATGFGRPEVLIGASAAVMAVFAAFCAVYPPVPLTFMIFFVLPVSVKPMTMLKIAAAMELAGFAVEILGGHPVVAYSAHLGGMAAGLAMIHMDRRKMLDSILSCSLPKTARRRSASDYKFKVNIGGDTDSKKELDRILDKINSEGFASLTDSERDFIKKAKNKL